ncbi:MAG TPA: FimV/HubP family polar landmark protein, partial [Gammaproteobacteria bacterium]|nr:FimV/HubP family polar landmark protein [Gammaproteobacteria bacterium]
MIRRAHWGTPLLLLAPCGAWALGLGDIELRSALNQPLDADIELVSATPEELANLRVALASPETFERYGLDRPGFLGRLIFSVARDNAGRPVIRVSSIEPITEPFVTVLVEATWARGRLLREYTVLLDPPVLLPREAAVEPVRPPAARVPEPATPAAPIERPPAAAPTPAPRPAPAPAAVEPPVTAPVTTPTPAPAPAPAPTPRPPVEGSSAGAYGPVQRGETLWGIASRTRPAGVTMNQMMVAIYRANPAAFAGNMNVLRQGATVELPSQGAIAAISAGEATQEAIAQTAAWRGGAPAEQQARLRLLPPEVATAAPAVAAGAAPSPGVTPSPTPAPATGSTATPPAAAERILSIEDEELSSLQQIAEQPAVTQVEPVPATEPGSVDGMVEPGVDLEAEEIFADETELGAAATPPEVEEAPIAPVEEPAAPTRAVSTQVVSSPAEPSLLSRVLGWLTTPLVWMIAGLVVLVGGAAVYLRSRQAEGEDMTGR